LRSQKSKQKYPLLNEIENQIPDTRAIIVGPMPLKWWMWMSAVDFGRVGNYYWDSTGAFIGHWTTHQLGTWAAKRRQWALCGFIYLWRTLQVGKYTLC
jgi:hypothetical protein